jgi:hypothetical protein
MRGLFALLCAVSLLSVSAPATNAAAPLNDSRDNAIDISTLLPYEDTVDTTEATTSANDLLKPGPYVGDPATALDATVWYTYTADQNAQLTVEVEPVRADVVLLVENPELSWINVTSYWLSIDVVAGSTYVFMLGDSDIENGIGGIWTFRAYIYAEPPPPPVVALDVTSLRLDGDVLVVGGTLTLVSGSYDHSIGSLQAVQKGKLRAEGSVILENPGASWTVNVHGFNGGAMTDARTTITVQLVLMDEDGIGLEVANVVKSLNIAKVPKK